jgi:hypothetical protein
VRIGNPTGDGGYVFLDRLRTSQKVYSFGIGSDVTLDLDFATRGHEVFLMDHTISEPPAEHERFCFISEGIAGVSVPARGLFSLAEHLSRRRDDDSDLILKMDVAGAEWETLSAATPDVLCRFEQIGALRSGRPTTSYAGTARPLGARSTIVVSDGFQCHSLQRYLPSASLWNSMAVQMLFSPPRGPCDVVWMVPETAAFTTMPDAGPVPAPVQRALSPSSARRTRCPSP